MRNLYQVDFCYNEQENLDIVSPLYIVTNTFGEAEKLALKKVEEEGWKITYISYIQTLTSSPIIE